MYYPGHIKMIIHPLQIHVLGLAQFSLRRPKTPSFHFMYSNKAALSGHNVLQVMYAAKKYLLEGLVQQCSNFLEDEISKDNVCTVLKHCLFYDETILADKCVAFVADDPKVIFESL